MQRQLLVVVAAASTRSIRGRGRRSSSSGRTGTLVPGREPARKGGVDALDLRQCHGLGAGRGQAETQGELAQVGRPEALDPLDGEGGVALAHRKHWIITFWVRALVTSSFTNGHMNVLRRLGEPTRNNKISTTVIWGDGSQRRVRKTQ